jgi:hypothetical protein
MRLLVLLACGCHFGVDALVIDAAVPADGSAPDANIDLAAPPPDFNLFDFAVAHDFARNVPDGAMPRMVGFPCSVAADCANGLCIDGYCCDQLCDPFDPANKCRACNVPGSEGHCIFAESGTDPRGLCDQTDVTTCGQDGTCDGNGDCRLWGAGSLCGPGSCSGGSVSAPPACDGIGNCVVNPTTMSCDPYDCAGAACATMCTPMMGCAAGAFCSSGLCNAKAGLGASCGSDNECASGFCSKGTCCSSDCSGACLSCALPGARGLCLPVAAGSDPFNECAASPRASCGLDGSCDGVGACSMWPATTSCAPRTCQGDSTVAPRFCDGNGTCLPGVASPCNPYTCEAATGVCFGQPCASSAQCAAGKTCRSNGKCN